mgnify:CR=1 FL=1
MQFITTVNWWQAGKNTGENAPLDRHEELLSEIAIDHISNQMSQGITSGELNANINMAEIDGEDGVDYRGHWSFEVHTPVGSADNPVVAVVKEDKESGGFLMSVSNIDHCEVVLIEDDLNGDGNEVDIEGSDVVGWSTSCDKDVSRTHLYSQSF